MDCHLLDYPKQWDTSTHTASVPKALAGLAVLYVCCVGNVTQLTTNISLVPFRLLFFFACIVVLPVLPVILFSYFRSLYLFVCCNSLFFSFTCLQLVFPIFFFPSGTFRMRVPLDPRAAS